MDTQCSFSVEEPPADAIKSRMYQERHGTQKAYDFCVNNPNQWCKLFQYEVYELRDAHATYATARAKLTVLRRFASERGRAFECFVHRDKATHACIVWGKILSKEEQ